MNIPMLKQAPWGFVESTQEGLLLDLMTGVCRFLVTAYSEFDLHWMKESSFAMSMNLALDCLLVSWIDI